MLSSRSMRVLPIPSRSISLPKIQRPPSRDRGGAQLGCRWVEPRDGLHGWKGGYVAKIFLSLNRVISVVLDHASAVHAPCQISPLRETRARLAFTRPSAEATGGFTRGTRGTCPTVGGFHPRAPRRRDCPV